MPANSAFQNEAQSLNKFELTSISTSSQHQDQKQKNCDSETKKKPTDAEDDCESTSEESLRLVSSNSPQQTNRQYPRRTEDFPSYSSTGRDLSIIVRPNFFYSCFSDQST